MSEDLWNGVGDSGTTSKRADDTTAEATKEWTQKNAKAEFALKSSISAGVLECVTRCKLAIYISKH